ncbi:hypothetical protein [Pseudomonas sp. S1_E04]
MRSDNDFRGKRGRIYLGVVLVCELLNKSVPFFVRKHYGVAAELLAEGQIFQQLGNDLNAVHGGVVKDVEGRLGVDE